MSAPVAYVANNGSHEVSVIDTATNTVVTTVPVDGAPIRLAVTPDGKRAYIAIRTPDNTGTVSVLDAATNTLVATETVTDFFIAGVAITPDGKQAYVANSGNANAVTVLDTATNTVLAEIPQRESIDLAFAPDGKHAYVTDFDGVSVIDTIAQKVQTTIPTAKAAAATVGRGLPLPRTGNTPI